MRIRWFFLFLLLLPMLVGAEETCFDYDAWKQAVIAGDLEQARQVVLQAQTACRCASIESACLPLPGTGKPTSVQFMTKTALRLQNWTETLAAACDALPEDTDAEKRSKVNCYHDRAQVFSEGLAGEEHGSLLRLLPEQIAARRIVKLNVGPAPPLQTEDPRTRYKHEARVVGKQICDLSARLAEQDVLLDQVRRRNPRHRPEDKLKREKELVESTRQLRDMIRALKKKFRLLTGEDFDPYTFCGSISEL